MQIFNLPDLGEGLPDAEIHEWFVKEGDQVTLDQPLVSMETAKAVVDVPCPQEGKIAKLYGQPGDIIKTGEPLIAFAASVMRPDKGTVVGNLEETGEISDDQFIIGRQTPTGQRVKATPAVRLLAKKLEINLQAIKGTGDHGIITKEDVQRASKKGLSLPEKTTFPANDFPSTHRPSSRKGKTPLYSPANREAASLALGEKDAVFSSPRGSEAPASPPRESEAPSSPPRESEAPASPTREKEGLSSSWQENTALPLPEGYEPLHGVRRAMLNIMSQSHQEVVSVSIFDEANVQSWKPRSDISIRLIRALIAACKQEGALNAWFDKTHSARKCFKEVNLGIAMDSAEGLFVPVIHNASQYSDEELRQIINEYKQGVQKRTIAADKLKGATISLSNFGKFAGRFANPVVVPPTVAILAVGRLYEGVAVIKGKIEPQALLPLSLSFDHRAVTGGEATRFLGAIIESLQKP